MSDSLPKGNPTEPAFMQMLRDFVEGKDFAAAELEVAANAYMELLRAYLLGVRDMIRVATVSAPVTVRALLAGLPRPDIERTTDQVLAFRPPSARSEGISPAVRNLLERNPLLAQTAEEVAPHFRRQAIYYARATSLQTTRKVQEITASLMQEGVPVPDATDIIKEATGWARGYSETAYRTNSQSAYVAGIIEAQTKPTISSVFIAFRVVGSNDANTRRGRPEDRGENHLAALGLTAENMDPIWSTHTPPYGYNCRHSLRPVSRMEAEDNDWLDSAGRFVRQEPPNLSAYSPKPGFGIRPSTMP